MKPHSAGGAGETGRKREQADADLVRGDARRESPRPWGLKLPATTLDHPSSSSSPSTSSHISRSLPSLVTDHDTPPASVSTGAASDHIIPGNANLVEMRPLLSPMGVPLHGGASVLMSTTTAFPPCRDASSTNTSSLARTTKQISPRTDAYRRGVVATSQAGTDSVEDDEVEEEEESYRDTPDPSLQYQSMDGGFSSRSLPTSPAKAPPSSASPSSSTMMMGGNLHKQLNHMNRIRATAPAFSGLSGGFHVAGSAPSAQSDLGLYVDDGGGGGILPPHAVPSAPNSPTGRRDSGMGMVGIPSEFHMDDYTGISNTSQISTKSTRTPTRLIRKRTTSHEPHQRLLHFSQQEQQQQQQHPHLMTGSLPASSHPGLARSVSPGSQISAISTTQNVHPMVGGGVQVPPSLDSRKPETGETSAIKTTSAPTTTTTVAAGTAVETSALLRPSHPHKESQLFLFRKRTLAAVQERRMAEQQQLQQGEESEARRSTSYPALLKRTASQSSASLAPPPISTSTTPPSRSGSDSASAGDSVEAASFMVGGAGEEEVCGARGGAAVIRLPRGGVVVHTQTCGWIQFGIPPETIKDTMKLGIDVPRVFVVPKERFDIRHGLNMCELEFPAYFQFFLQKRSVKVCVTRAVEEELRPLLREVLLGPHPEYLFPEEEVFPAASAGPHSSKLPLFHTVPDLERELKYFVQPRDGREISVDSMFQFVHFEPTGEGGGDDDLDDKTFSTSSHRTLNRSSEILGTPSSVSSSARLDNKSSSRLSPTRPSPTTARISIASSSKRSSSPREEPDGYFATSESSSHRRASVRSRKSSSSSSSLSPGGIAVARFHLNNSPELPESPSLALTAAVVGELNDNRAAKQPPPLNKNGGSQRARSETEGEDVVAGFEADEEVMGGVRPPHQDIVAEDRAFDYATTTEYPQTCKLNEHLEIRDTGNEWIVIEYGVEIARVKAGSVTTATRVGGSSGPIVPLNYFSPPVFGVTVLGSSHGFDKDQSTSGFVLWMHGKGIMVDPPPDASERLREQGIPPRLVNAIILTHCHADHDAGTFQKILVEGRVTLMTTKTVMASFLRKYSRISTFTESFLCRLFEPRVVGIGEEVYFGGGVLTFFYSLHALPCVGFHARVADKTFIYSADTFYEPDSLKKLRDDGVLSPSRYDALLSFPFETTDVVLHEAGIPPIHTPVEALCKLSDAAKERLYIIHVSDVAAAKSGLKLARAGTEYTIRIVDSVPSFDSAAPMLDVLTQSELFVPSSGAGARNSLGVLMARAAEHYRESMSALGSPTTARGSPRASDFDFLNVRINPGGAVAALPYAFEPGTGASGGTNLSNSSLRGSNLHQAFATGTSYQSGGSGNLPFAHRSPSMSNPPYHDPTPMKSSLSSSFATRDRGGTASFLRSPAEGPPPLAVPSQSNLVHPGHHHYPTWGPSTQSSHSRSDAANSGRRSSSSADRSAEGEFSVAQAADLLRLCSRLERKKGELLSAPIGKPDTHFFLVVKGFCVVVDERGVMVDEDEADDEATEGGGSERQGASDNTADDENDEAGESEFDRSRAESGKKDAKFTMSVAGLLSTPMTVKRSLSTGGGADTSGPSLVASSSASSSASSKGSRPAISDRIQDAKNEHGGGDDDENAGQKDDVAEGGLKKPPPLDIVTVKVATAVASSTAPATTMKDAPVASTPIATEGATTVARSKSSTSSSAATNDSGGEVINVEKNAPSTQELPPTSSKGETSGMSPPSPASPAHIFLTDSEGSHGTILEGGDCFGISALGGRGKPRKSEVRALTDVVLICLDEAALGYMLKVYPALNDRMNRIHRARASSVWRYIEMNSCLKRLATFQKSQLMTICHERRYKKGEKLWETYQPVNSAFLVAEGELTFLEMKGELGHQPFRAGAWLCDVQSLVNYRAARMYEEANPSPDPVQQAHIQRQLSSLDGAGSSLTLITLTDVRVYVVFARDALAFLERNPGVLVQSYSSIVVE